jgi:hypothetical protein
VSYPAWTEDKSIPPRRVGEPAWYEKARALKRQMGVPESVMIEIAVAHDSWCASSRRLPCDCDADVRYAGPLLS